MSYKNYIKQAAKQKSEVPAGKEPVVNRFSDIEAIDRRRHEVLDYLLIGYDADEISTYMGESKSVIENDIKEILKIGYKARDEDLTEVRDEIARLYRIAVKEGFRAFRLSQGEHVKRVEERGTDSEGMPYEKEKISYEEKAGDPRFLSLIVDAGKELGKVTGAQKHRETEIQTNINNTNAVQILSPNRTRMPNDFDRWTKKPQGKEVPSSDGIDSEDLENG